MEQIVVQTDRWVDCFEERKRERGKSRGCFELRQSSQRMLSRHALLFAFVHTGFMRRTLYGRLLLLSQFQLNRSLKQKGKEIERIAG